MPLPDGFSPAEHLQDLIRRYMNREVREFFSDLGGEDWDPDITTSRGALRVGCTHLDDDSLPMTHLRWALFNHVRTLKFQQPYYGVPVGSVHQSRIFKPKITLYFQEDLGDVDPGYNPIDGVLTFRLMDFTHETITPAIAQTFANRIRTNFSAGGGYRWHKGKHMASYTDQPRGYKLQLLSFSKSDARSLIERVLDIQNHAPDWRKMNWIENEEAASTFPTIPRTERIYGETRREPRRRPVGYVRFQCAHLDVWGVPTPITLVDRTGTYLNPLAS